MNIKNTFTGIAMASLIGFGGTGFTNASADDYYQSDDGFYDYAKVIKVRPIYRTVQISTPRQECWNEERVEYYDGYNRSATPVVIGGLLGGVIGNRFGKGRGRDVATVAGIALGASIASDMRKNKHPGHSRVVNEPVCKTINEYVEEERLDGYKVRYRYKGHIYSTRMNEHPGKKIRVHVQVSPAG
jgi:uncharacterized protein YcfJ